MVKSIPKLDGDHMVIGAYYETQDGRVAYTYGWGGRSHVVSYRFDDKHGGRSATEEEWSTWKPRPDLRDFPNATDPRLPYALDLHWDIKYTSELLHVWNTPYYDDREAIIQMAREYEIPGPWAVAKDRSKKSKKSKKSKSKR